MKKPDMRKLEIYIINLLPLFKFKLLKKNQKNKKNKMNKKSPKSCFLEIKIPKFPI